MSFLDFFKQAKLHSTWNYETNGVLWRLLPTTNHVFVGEDRNLETKKVTFFCLDAVSGKILWNNLSFTEPWWISIEGVYENTVFLHEFATPDMPDHKKIYAVNVHTAQILWVNEELQFHFAYREFVYGSKIGFERRHYFRLDSTNGNIVGEINAVEFQQLQSEAFDSTSNNLVFAKEVGDVAELKESYKNIVLRVLNVQQPIECISQNGNLILSLYTVVTEKMNSNTQLEQQVIIADREGRLLYRDTVNERMKIPHPDSVMMMNGIVYYIKNKKSLIAVKLFE
ncbi:MAG: DUF4905 domain-containing protein [Ignavibacteriae bacterium]|nr:DUF4905 domain-containing protein [Ignavibacteriota bacterium]